MMTIQALKLGRRCGVISRLSVFTSASQHLGLALIPSARSYTECINSSCQFHGACKGSPTCANRQIVNNSCTITGIEIFTSIACMQADCKICSSFSDFHPGSWNPPWSVSTILTGLLSFMLADEITTGSVRTTDAEKRELAKVSHAWNRKNPKFKTIFPEFVTTEMQRLPNMGEGDLGKPDKPNEPPLPANMGGDAPSSTGTPPSSNDAGVPALSAGLGSLDIGKSSTAGSVQAETVNGKAAAAASTTRRVMFGFGALVAAALFMRVLGV